MNPSGTFKRGTPVEYAARSLLRSRGYEVTMARGAQSPFDIIAWNDTSPLLFVRAVRWRHRITDRKAVPKNFHRHLSALRVARVPKGASVHFWVWTAGAEWRFFSVMPGGICEVDGV